MERILLFGSPGAGKSTLAIKLGEILNIEVIHLDRIFWKSGWNSISRAELREEIEKIIKRKTWIMDGNYTDTIDIRLDSADTAVFLDFSRLFCIFRVIKRYIHYGKRVRPDLPPGCPEQIDLDFYKFIWNYPVNYRSLILQKLEEKRSHKKIFILKSPSEVKQFLNNVIPFKDADLYL